MNIEEKPWFKFMEETLKNMYESDIDKIVLVAFSSEKKNIAVSWSDGTTTNDMALAGFWLTQEASSWAQEDAQDDCEDD